MYHHTAAHLLALAAMTLTGTAVADVSQTPGQGGGAYHYTYHKQIQPLALDGSRIAIRAASADVVATAVIEAKVPATKIEAHGISGWWLISGFAGGAMDPGAAEEAVGALAGAAGVDFAAPVFVDEYGGPMFPTQSLLVGFIPDLAEHQRDGLVSDAAPSKLEIRDWMPDVDVYTPATRNGFEVLAASNALAASDKTLFAEPDMIFSGRHGAIPNDPMFNQLWGLHNTGQSGGLSGFDMNIPEAWDVHAGSSAIINVVIDSGVDLTHPDLNLAAGADFTGAGGNGAPMNACDNHGTWVAGCIAGRRNNSAGIVGAAPGCRVAPARTFVSSLACDGSWNSQASWTVNTLNWAQSIGARVTNNSNGYGFTSASIDTAYSSTRSAGIVHFASAGNDGSSTLAYPARYAPVMAVGAADRFGNRASFSQTGQNLDVMGPGVSITTTDRQGAAGVAGDFAIVDGTSFASPYASSVACLLLSRDPAMSAQTAEAFVIGFCRDMGAAGYDQQTGHGLVNAQASLNFIVPPGDGCSSAVEVPFGTYNKTLVGAGNPTSVGGVCGSAGGNPDVWYRYVAPLAGTIIVHTCGTHDAQGTDTVLSLHSSCTASAVACSDDAIGPCGSLDTGTQRDSYLERSMAAGEAILVRVSKFGASAVGPFRLTIGFVAANDSCSNATNVSAGGTYFGHLRYTSNDQALTAACGASGSNPDAWYAFTAPATCPGQLTVSTCGTHDASGRDTGMDTVLSLHTACGTEPIACNDDTTACGPIDAGAFRDSMLTRSVGAGQTILIRVSKFSTATPGAFQLNVSWSGAADFNRSGTVTVQDIFDFLAAYFNNSASADINASGTVTVQDIFDFLGAYFSNCA